jgi:hypothetical protein
VRKVQPFFAPYRSQKIEPLNQCKANGTNKMPYFNNERAEHIKEQTGRCIRDWLLKWFGDSLEILEENVHDQVNVPDDINNSINTLRQIIDCLRNQPENPSIPNNYLAPARQELKEYMEYIDDDAAPDAERFMRYLLMADYYLMKAILRSWPREGPMN